MRKAKTDMQPYAMCAICVNVRPAFPPLLVLRSSRWPLDFVTHVQDRIDSDAVFGAIVFSVVGRRCVFLDTLPRSQNETVKKTPGNVVLMG